MAGLRAGTLMIGERPSGSYEPLVLLGEAGRGCPALRPGRGLMRAGAALIIGSTLIVLALAAGRGRLPLRPGALDEEAVSLAAYCQCDWIMKDDCSKSDDCACFCRQNHPEGPCTTCAQGSLHKAFIGVNLGGWLVLEDWMWHDEMSAKGIPDEWTLVQRHGGPEDPAAIELMKNHWETFLTEEDLDRLLGFGVTHVRIPVGYWMVDYDPKDGFVNGSSFYLQRAIGWLHQRNMKALIDLHALPCAQAVAQSFTGKKLQKAYFFEDLECYTRGKGVMRKFAHLILSYEDDPATSDVVIGMNLVNEPDWSFYTTVPGLQDLYTTMIPDLRTLLPAEKYSLHIFFWDVPGYEGAYWLASMKEEFPGAFDNVVYDLHLYHSFGDDNKKGRHWDPRVDSCKTCCRDHAILRDLAAANMSIAVGEYSLVTGFPGGPEFWKEFLRLQMSLWQNSPGVVGSFFWNHRILLPSNGYYREMSLLHLIAPEGSVPRAADLNWGVGLCPGYDLTKCPTWEPGRVGRKDICQWLP